MNILEKVLRTEQKMISEAKLVYGDFFSSALEANELLKNSLVKVDAAMFSIQYALVIKHHTLALLSAVTLQQSQSDWNLRHVLESAVKAAYAIENNDLRTFFTIDADDNWKERIYNPSIPWFKWIKEAHPKISSLVSDIKKDLQYSCHSYPFQAANAFQIKGDNFLNYEFCDNVGSNLVKLKLWKISCVASIVLNLIYQANAKSLFFSSDFRIKLGSLDKKLNILSKSL